MSLQPLLDSPLAQWALGAAEQGPIGTDRSGNARHLTWGLAPGTGGQITTPIEGELAPDSIVGSYCWSNFLSGSMTSYPRQMDAVFRRAGTLTITLRAYLWGLTSRVDQCFISCAGSRNGTSPQNCLYLFGARYSAPNFVLQYAAEHSGGVDISAVSTLALVPGHWYFCALRRAADGTVRFTKGTSSAANTHQTSGALVVPTDGSSGHLRLGYDDVMPIYVGGIADVCLWDHELTDEQLETLRDLALSDLDVYGG